MGIDRTGSNPYIVCTSGTRPSPASEGTMIYETDTDLLLAYDGSGWRPFAAIDGTTTASGKWDLLGTLTNPGSGATQMGGTLSSSTHINLVIMYNVKNTAGSASNLGYRLNNDSGNNYEATIVYGTSVSGPLNYHSGSISFGRLGYATASAGHLSGRAEIEDISNPTGTMRHTYQSYLIQPSVVIQYENGGGWWNNSSAVTRFDFYTTYSLTGTVRLYGVRA